MREQDDQIDNHRERQMLTAYVGGACSLGEKRAIEAHCLICRPCRSYLALLLHLGAILENEDGFYELEGLFPVGLEAALRARQLAEREAFSGRPLSRLRAAFAKRLGEHRTSLQMTSILIVVLLGGIACYLTWWRQSPDERLLVRLRDLYRNSRPLQGRVTGGFAHRSYMVVRGPAGFTISDEGERLILLIELERKERTGASALTHHLLGRLYLLGGDFGPAEKQLRLAMQERPRDADLYADLGALYFERSRKREHEDRTLLERAVEYISKAIDLNPRLPEAWFNRALCYQEMNLFPQAVIDWERYLELDRDSAWAEESRQHLIRLRGRKALESLTRDFIISGIYEYNFDRTGSVFFRRASLWPSAQASDRRLFPQS